MILDVVAKAQGITDLTLAKLHSMVELDGTFLHAHDTNYRAILLWVTELSEIIHQSMENRGPERHVVAKGQSRKSAGGVHLHGRLKLASIKTWFRNDMHISKTAKNVMHTREDQVDSIHSTLKLVMETANYASHLIGSNSKFVAFARR